jgi:hypothetical protein
LSVCNMETQHAEQWILRTVGWLNVAEWLAVLRRSWEVSVQFSARKLAILSEIFIRCSVIRGKFGLNTSD